MLSWIPGLEHILWREAVLQERLDQDVLVVKKKHDGGLRGEICLQVFLSSPTPSLKCVPEKSIGCMLLPCVATQSREVGEVGCCGSAALAEAECELWGAAEPCD